MCKFPFFWLYSNSIDGVFLRPIALIVLHGPPMPSVRISLAGSYVNRNANPGTSKDQQIINLVPEVIKNPITGQGKVYLNKRTGSAGTTVAQANYLGSALHAWAQTPSSIVIASAFYTTPGTAEVFLDGSTLGTIANTNVTRFIGSTEVSGVATLVLLAWNTSSSTWQMYYYQPAGSLTNVTSVNFPSNQSPAKTTVGDPAFMDGYTFIMCSDGTIWNSDLNSIANWTATSFISANAYPDHGAGLARYQDKIVAFGRRSTQFYYNAGNATGSPLNGIPGATLNIGASLTIDTNALITGVQGQRTILTCGNTVYWIGVDQHSGATGVYRLNGMQAEKVSTPAIDKLLYNAPFEILGAFHMFGKQQLLIGGSSGSYCYSMEDNFWWNFTNSLQFLRIVGINTTDFTSSAPVDGSGTTSFQAISSLGTSPRKVFKNSIVTPVYTDDTATFTATVQTELLDMGTQHAKFWRRIRPVCDLQSSTSNLAISWAYDDSWSYSTPINIDTSSQVAINDGITGLGSSKRISFKLAHAAATPCRLEAIEIEYDVAAV